MVNKLKVGLLTALAATTFALAPVAEQVAGTVFEPTIEAHAVGETSTANKGSRKALNQVIKDKVNSKKYAVDGGGTLTGAQLVKDGDIIESNYNRLTAKARQNLITDMTQATTDAVAKTEKKQESGSRISGDAITAQTQQNWIQELQAHPGVGSRMLTDILQTVKPDYAGARYIIEPFAGPLNIAIAAVVIVLMTLLTLTFVIDLSFIYIPFFQAAASTEGGGKDGGFAVGNLVSNEAKQAVKDADNGKAPAGTYFKKRFIGVALLGLCILFFAQGQVYVVTGWLLDLLSGILNLG